MKIIVVLVSLFLIVVSCSSNSPKSVTLNCLNAITDGDFERAKEYGDKGTNGLFDLVLAFGAQASKFM